MGKADVFQEMAEKWDSAMVARTQIEKFTGGLMSAKYMANLDSMGLGAERVTVGRKVAYPVNSLIQWLRDRAN